MSETFTTTYTYAQLPPRHIRLLQVTHKPAIKDGGDFEFEYRIVHVELPADGAAPAFEAVSYTWGDHVKVSALQLQDGEGVVALKANLTEALPHLSRNSSTKHLWIDQLCINQTDNAEKSVQVGFMAEVYSKAKSVLVWLGPEDDATKACKEWLAALEELLPTLPNANRTRHGSEEYLDAYRFLNVTHTFSNSTWAPELQYMLGKFWSRVYFRRSWIVQEFLLNPELVILTGSTRFTIEELGDMYCVPLTQEMKATMDNWSAYRTLMPLKRWPHSGTQPLRFLRLMASCAREFEASYYGDALYSTIGMLEGLNFKPDYAQSTKYNFTNFAATVARDFGSIGFLGLCAAKLDTLIKDTPEEVQGFPSWVPSWTALPLETPWRLVTGGTHHWIGDVLWNASAGRKHTWQQPADPVSTMQLHVRGKVVDYIDTISSAIIGAKHYDAETAYLEALVAQLQRDLPSCCAAWTPTDLIDFLNGPVFGGNEIKPFDTASAILGPGPRYVTQQEELDVGRSNDALGIRLTIGRGRRLARTEEGRLALIPFIDSRARSESARGSLIVVLHGCIVPLVLECEDETRCEYRVVGEAYMKDMMHGEAVTWGEDEADEFVLV